VGKGSGGMTRGDRRRNVRRERLRGLLPRDGAVVGIDLGDEKQAIAVVDHDVRVLARKTVRVKAFRLGEALDWALARARAKGFAQVTEACEPTGSRWLQVQRLCAERAVPLVCIQPLMSHIAREQQDLTMHKSDESDCVLIGRLAIELHCYIPEEPGAVGGGQPLTWIPFGGGRGMWPARMPPWSLDDQVGGLAAAQVLLPGSRG
jgi:transposase